MAKAMPEAARPAIVSNALIGCVFGGNRGEFKPVALPCCICATIQPVLAASGMPDALSLLTTRRSVKPIELNGPAPSAAEIDTILTIASRVPDHGKLTPWRFIVFEGDARTAIGEAIADGFHGRTGPMRPPIRSNSSATGWRAHRW